VSPVLSAAAAPLIALVLPLLAIGVAAAQRQGRPSAGVSQDHDGRGALAVLRRDGVLLPFASFDRDSWRGTWPVRIGPGLEIPVTKTAVPKGWWGTSSPDQWRGHLVTGDETFFELGQPVVFPSYCDRSLGIRTTYRSAQSLPPVRVDPFPKDGLAVSGGIPVEPIETVSTTDPGWPALAVSLVEDFDRVEEETVRRVRGNTGWRHPLRPEQRRTRPVRLESWYRSPGSEEGWTISYVEAVRQYPNRPEDGGCGLETLVSGWVHHRNGELMRDGTELRAKLTYCDRVGATYMLPLGRIRPAKVMYWVFQLSGWESEWYEVVSVRPQRVRYVLEVLAGAGRRCF
jgi:hypothetical protein